MVITTQGSFSQPQAALSSSHEININRCIYPLCFCNEHTRSVLATTPIVTKGLEPIPHSLEGCCSLHLRYVTMCVSISCMPTFKELTQRNTYGYFFNVGHPPVTYVLSWERPNPVGKEGVEPSVFLMSRFYRPLQSPLCAFPQNLCRITTTKLLAHLSATYRLLQSRYRLIDADKVFHRYMVAMLQAVTWKTLTSLATALNSIPL